MIFLTSCCSESFLRRLIAADCNIVNIITETGIAVAAAQKGKKVLRVFITDGSERPLVGNCVYFLRDKKEEIGSNNVTVSNAIKRLDYLLIFTLCCTYIDYVVAEHIPLLTIP